MNTCLYFTRLTVDEEQSFLPVPSTFLDRFFAVAASLPACRNLMNSFYDSFGCTVSAAAATYQPPGDLMQNKTIQAVLFVMIAHVLEETGRIGIADIGFYSGGIQPALIFAGCVTLEKYLVDVLPFFRESRYQIATAGEQHDLVECLLIGEPEEDVAAFVGETINRRGIEDRVFIKDMRGRNVTLVAGRRIDVIELQTLACAQFASIMRRQPRVHRTDGAHIPMYDRKRTENLLANISLKPPRFRMIGTCGEVVENGCQNTKRLRTLLADAAAGPMNTGSAVQSISHGSERILAIGSPLGSKVLNQLDVGLPLTIRLASEFI